MNFVLARIKMIDVLPLVDILPFVWVVARVVDEVDVVSVVDDCFISKSNNIWKYYSIFEIVSNY